MEAWEETYGEERGGDDGVVLKDEESEVENEEKKVYGVGKENTIIENKEEETEMMEWKEE